MKNKRVRNLIAAVGIASIMAVPVAINIAGGATNSAIEYQCFMPNGIATSRPPQLTQPTCATGNHWESWQTATQPTATTTTTQPATTTTQATTTTAPTTTTTQPSNSTFLSYP